MTIKHIICYSGGHSSALVAIEVVRKFGKENTILLNHDINETVEDLDIKRFKEEVAKYLELSITYANYNDQLASIPDQFDIISKIGYFTDKNRNVLCTYELKTKPFTKYLKENFKDKNCIIYYGFDKNETKRITRRSSILGNMGFKSDYPLALWKDRTIESTNEIGITPPLTYSTFKHANCTGCLKAGQQHWYAVYCTRQDIWDKAKKLEQEIDYSIIKNNFLEELEPKFKIMKEYGIVPTEHINALTFWASVRKKLKDIEVGTDESSKPCECIF